jgi:hypothetical protein
VAILQLEGRLAADDVDEEDGHGGEKDNLKDRVDDDEDGAVVSVSVGKLVPDLIGTRRGSWSERDVRVVRREGDEP